MNQLNQLWGRLSWAQRIWLATAALAVSGGIFALNRWTQERDFKPLFSGLAPEDAGAVTSRLREMAVEYRLGSEGSEVLVPSAKVAEARLRSASSCSTKQILAQANLQNRSTSTGQSKVSWSAPSCPSARWSRLGFM